MAEGGFDKLIDALREMPHEELVWGFVAANTANGMLATRLAQFEQGPFPGRDELEAAAQLIANQALEEAVTLSHSKHVADIAAPIIEELNGTPPE